MIPDPNLSFLLSVLRTLKLRSVMVTYSHSWCRVMKMTMHYRGWSRSQYYATTNVFESPWSLKVTHGHSRSLRVTDSNWWYKAMTIVYAPPDFDPSLSTKLPSMSMHQHNYSKSIKVTQDHFQSLLVTLSHSWIKATTDVYAPPGFKPDLKSK